MLADEINMVQGRQIHQVSFVRRPSSLFLSAMFVLMLFSFKAEAVSLGAYQEEKTPGTWEIKDYSSHITLFFGLTLKKMRPKPFSSFREFSQFYKNDIKKGDPAAGYMEQSVKAFFLNGGKVLYILPLKNKKAANFYWTASKSNKLKNIGIVAVPGYGALPSNLRDEFEKILVKHVNDSPGRFALLETPQGKEISQLRLKNRTDNGAKFGPWLRVGNPTTGAVVPPTGFIAGGIARTDLNRGIHKSPGGLEARLIGAVGTETEIPNSQEGAYNKPGINSFLIRPGQKLFIWGGKTYDPYGNYRYIAVARTARYLGSNIKAQIGKYMTFEAVNPYSLAKIKRTVSLYLERHRRNGMFAGASAQKSYFIKFETQGAKTYCILGFALVNPGEFVVIQFAVEGAEF